MTTTTEQPTMAQPTTARREAKGPAPLRFSGRQGEVALKRTFELVTPVFGGGVSLNPDANNRHIKHIDDVTPIRTASIRGQLRFWWRATTGCLQGSVREMRDAEAALWGGPSQPGKVSVRLEPKDVRVREEIVAEGYSAIAYAGFPLRPERGATDKRTGVAHTVRGTFHLHLLVPEARGDEVELALNAWLTFGGLGGRTRRGFGAVAPADEGQRQDPAQLIERVTRAAAGSQPLPEVPSLVGARLALKPGTPDARKAWEKGLAAMKDFRQGKGFARNPGHERNRPGRSRWPEPDQIRRLTKKHADRHPPEHPVDKFPRAAFGMPIIFHFKDRGDPDDTTLKPRDARGEVQERMASPLILRPASTGHGFQPLALALTVRRDRPLTAVLEGGRHKQDVEVALSHGEAKKIHPLQAEPDVLAAFLSFFQNGR